MKSYSQGHSNATRIRSLWNLFLKKKNNAAPYCMYIKSMYLSRIKMHTGWPVKYCRVFLVPSYATVHVFTGQVTFAKVPEKTRPCLTCQWSPCSWSPNLSGSDLRKACDYERTILNGKVDVSWLKEVRILFVTWRGRGDQEHWRAAPGTP